MLERLRTTEPIDTALGIALALSLLVTLPAFGLDTRLFEGTNVWAKTIKFQLALSVYFLTLAYFAHWIPEAVRRNRWYKLYTYVVCFTVVGEMMWIGGASASATASHYNTTSTFMSAVYGLMGVFALTLTSKSLVFGWLIWRNPDTGLDAALQSSIALGLALTFILTAVAGGSLSTLSGHHVGEPVTGAAVPIMGWSLEVGDPRVAHFMATHAMHFIPLAGLCVLVLQNRTNRQLAVVSAAIIYSGFVGFVLAQALSGNPILPLQQPV